MGKPEGATEGIAEGGTLVVGADKLAVVGADKLAAVGAYKLAAVGADKLAEGNYASAVKKGKVVAGTAQWGNFVHWHIRVPMVGRLHKGV